MLGKTLQNAMRVLLFAGSVPLRGKTTPNFVSRRGDRDGSGNLLGLFWCASDIRCLPPLAFKATPKEPAYSIPPRSVVNFTGAPCRRLGRRSNRFAFVLKRTYTSSHTVLRPDCAKGLINISSFMFPFTGHKFCSSFSYFRENRAGIRLHLYTFPAFITRPKSAESPTGLWTHARCLVFRRRYLARMLTTKSRTFLS